MKCKQGNELQLAYKCIFKEIINLATAEERLKLYSCRKHLHKDKAKELLYHVSNIVQ